MLVLQGAVSATYYKCNFAVVSKLGKRLMKALETLNIQNVAIQSDTERRLGG